MKTYLKIKIASLAAEAVFIRNEEKKWKKPSFSQYKKDCRLAARAGGWPVALRLLQNLGYEVFVPNKEDLQKMPNPKDYGPPATPPHPMYQSLYHHRKHVVRPETRASLLAYGFMRGTDRFAIEDHSHTAPNWKRVEEIAWQFSKKYGTTEQQFKQRFEEWFQKGKSV